MQRLRRARYVAATCMDAKPGRLFDMPVEIGAADDTLIVVMSDPCDSPGGRGLLFRMSVFGWSVRVFFIAHPPAAFDPGRMREDASRPVPTPPEPAGEGYLPELAAPAGACPFVPPTTGPAADWPDAMLAECTAKGATAPLPMVRKGPRKLMTGPGDPPPPLDLDTGPDETRNLAAEIRTEPEAVAAGAWGASALGRAARELPAAWRVAGARDRRPLPPGLPAAAGCL